MRLSFLDYINYGVYYQTWDIFRFSEYLCNPRIHFNDKVFLLEEMLLSPLHETLDKWIKTFLILSVCCINKKYWLWYRYCTSRSNLEGTSDNYQANNILHHIWKHINQLYVQLIDPSNEALAKLWLHLCRRPI